MIFYPKNMKNRNHSIDFIRGVAIIMMVIYHWYCLLDIKNNTAHTKNIKIDLLGHVSRFIFIFLMGFSMSISHKKNKEDFKSRYIERSLYLMLYSIAITVITKKILKKSYVRFGILHYMATTMLFLSFIANYPNIMLFIGLIFYITYININNISSKRLIKNIFGYKTLFPTVDLFPISKWILLTCLGFYVGNSIDNIDNLNIVPENMLTNSISLLGKYSLEIYLLHWVVLHFLQKYTKS